MSSGDLEFTYVDDNYNVSYYKYTIEETDEQTITDSDWEDYYHNITKEIDETLTIDQ